MKTKIHINQHVIKRNKKEGTREPPITVKTYKSNTYANLVELGAYDALGRWLPVASVQYEADNPLSCGATVWIATSDENVRVVR